MILLSTSHVLYIWRIKKFFIHFLCLWMNRKNNTCCILFSIVECTLNLCMIEMKKFRNFSSRWAALCYFFLLLFINFFYLNNISPSGVFNVSEETKTKNFRIPSTAKIINFFKWIVPMIWESHKRTFFFFSATLNKKIFCLISERAFA